MENSNAWLMGIAFLIVGLGIGYSIGNDGVNGYGQMGTYMTSGGAMMRSGAPARGMGDMMEDMSALLEGKEGDEFDEAFLEMMIVHHEGAVEMAELALESAGHQEIKDLAEAIISAQNVEIEQMEAWQEDWYGE